jgi:hypothetical protein
VEAVWESPPSLPTTPPQITMNDLLRLSPWFAGTACPNSGPVCARRSDRPKHLRRISAARRAAVRLSPSTRERLRGSRKLLSLAHLIPLSPASRQLMPVTRRSSGKDIARNHPSHARITRRRPARTMNTREHRSEVFGTPSSQPPHASMLALSSHPDSCGQAPKLSPGASSWTLQPAFGQVPGKMLRNEPNDRQDGQSVGTDRRSATSRLELHGCMNLE